MDEPNQTTLASGYYWIVADNRSPEVAFWDDEWHRCGWDCAEPGVEIKVLDRQPLQPPSPEGLTNQTGEISTTAAIYQIYPGGQAVVLSVHDSEEAAQREWERQTRCARDGMKFSVTPDWKP